MEELLCIVIPFEWLNRPDLIETHANNYLFSFVVGQIRAVNAGLLLCREPFNVMGINHEPMKI